MLGSFQFRLIGTIPGPIFFGFIIDQTCELRDGNCLFYNNFHMALYLSFVVFGIKTLGVVFFGFAYYFSERSPIKDEPVSED